MLVCFWSLKGGSGCSVVTALTALAAARRGRDGGGGLDPEAVDPWPDRAAAIPAASAETRRPQWGLRRTALGATAAPPRAVTLVDLDGDLAAVLGAAPSAGPGVSDWLAAGADAPDDALRSAAHPIADGLSLVGPGTMPLPEIAPTDRQLDALDEPDDLVLVDGGCIFRPDAIGALARTFAAQSTRSVLVTRPCYLALRKASSAPIDPSSIVVLDEPGRALGRREIEEVVGAPIAAWVAVDPAVARAVDAGILATRVPRGLVRALEAVA